MTPLAVTRTDRRTDGAPRLAPNHCHRGSYDRPLVLSERSGASQALAENDAKDSMRKVILRLVASDGAVTGLRR
jgi:hypothetical protein